MRSPETFTAMRPRREERNMNDIRRRAEPRVESSDEAADVTTPNEKRRYGIADTVDQTVTDVPEDIPGLTPRRVAGRSGSDRPSGTAWRLSRCGAAAVPGRERRGCQPAPCTARRAAAISACTASGPG